MHEQNHIRPALDSIPSYVPGKPAPPDAFKVSSNESPFEPVPQIRDAVTSLVTGLNRYPDMAVLQLRAALAGDYGVDPSQIHVSTGASAVLGDLVRATVDQGDEVVFAWRSFEAYPIIVQSHGGVCVPVPLTESFEHDLDAMAGAVNERTRLVLLCSPNNPTGTAIGTEALRAFLEQIPVTVTVVLDEAYTEFADAEQRADSSALFAEFANLVRVRTFSKVHGIAGLRCGYAVAHPRLAQALAKVTVPFGANTLAQAAALAAREPAAQQELAQRIAWIKDERARVEDAAAAGGWDLHASHGNFVYLPLRERTQEFVQFAADRGLIVRGYGNDGVRITIAEEAANSRAIDVMGQWQSR